MLIYLPLVPTSDRAEPGPDNVHATCVNLHCTADPVTTIAYDIYVVRTDPLTHIWL